MTATLRLVASLLALAHICQSNPQSDRPTLSLNGGSYGLTGGPTLLPPAATNKPGSLYDSGASYGLGGAGGIRPGGGFNGPPGGGGFNGPPGGGGFNGPPGGGGYNGPPGGGGGFNGPPGGGGGFNGPPGGGGFNGPPGGGGGFNGPPGGGGFNRPPPGGGFNGPPGGGGFNGPPGGGGAGYGIAGNGPRPGGSGGGYGGYGGPPGGGFGINSDAGNFIEPLGGGPGGFPNRPGGAPPVHELEEDGPYYRPHFRPPFGVNGGHLPFPTKYGSGGTVSDVPFGGTGVGFQGGGGGILPGGRPPQKFPNRPLIGGGPHLGNIPGINGINNPKPLFGGGGGGFAGNPHNSQSDRPFGGSGPGGPPPPYGAGFDGNRPFGGSRPVIGDHNGHTPAYENPYLKDPSLFTGGYDTCKCALSFNCNSPGIKFGSCDAGKQYCCYNSHVSGSNKPKPPSFFGNTALHQHYARPELNPSGAGGNFIRPVRGPGVLVGPGGPVDVPPRGSGEPLIHPRKLNSSTLPATNKLFPGDE